MTGIANRWATHASVLLILLALSGLEPAHAQTRDFNVPSQSATTGIPEFARQAGIQILVSEPLVRGKRIATVTGSHSVEEGLAMLLRGTGLVGTSKDGATYTITTAPTPSGTQTQSAPNPIPPVLAPAQGAQGQASSPSTVARQDEQLSKQKPAQLEEVIVTGSRIPTVAGNEVLPVRSYTRESIENSGQTSIGEFLNTLPDVSTFVANATYQLGLAGAQTVQLHGLPAGTTLTLLDGRRMDSSIYGYFDLSKIPLAAVERIEILPVGASAIYGADGLGGAVNTILRKDFNGLEVNATLDHASGVNNPNASLVWGRSWERGSIALIGSYLETGELLGAQREPESLTSLPANLPGATVAAIANYSCAPGNVYSVDGSNLPGLSSSEAAIPAGISGRPTIGQFAATAGKQNLCNDFQYQDITPQSQREGALLSAHYEVAHSVDLFTEVVFSHGYLRNQVGPGITASQSFGGTVAANNPYNPFGEPVNVSFAYPGADEAIANVSTSLFRPMIGVRGSVFSDWHYEATVYFSRDRLYDLSGSTNYQQISAALASSDPSTALNPFTSAAPGTPQLLSSLNPAAAITSITYDDRTVGSQVMLRGPVLQLPAGALQAVIGSEYSQIKQDTNESYNPLPLDLHRNTYAAFTEARIPLLSAGEHSQGSERLALTLAGRYDHSDDYGGKATWQSGLLWRANEALSFSGSYGLSYQAPLLSQISGPPLVYVGPLFFPDPLRGNQLITYSVNYESGPNPDLKPETGDAFTLGLQYASRALPGLHASLSWYDLRITNFISVEQPATLLSYPNLFPGAIIRAPATPQDQQQGFAGLITQFNQIFYNFGDLRVAGLDADISYTVETRAGQFTPSVAIANVYRWQSAITPGSPEIDAVSKATNPIFGGGVGWSPRWKGTAGLAWKQGPLALNLAGRYLGRYLDDQEFVPNTHEIGNTWIFDFNARYEAGHALASANPWLKGTYVELGAVNVLNKTPPLSYTTAWYDMQEYDIRGRFLHLSVGMRF
jgi:iron complex outermembrane recepter protein